MARDSKNVKDAFSDCHPVVNLLYFTLVIAFTMIFMHPVCILISLSCSFAYAVYLNGNHSIRFMLVYLLPLMLFTAALNPLFSHAGVTILTYFPNGNPLTLESIFYGIAAALLLASVVLWFSTVNIIMTSDKLVFLFGRVVPSVSILLSMTLRFIPRFKAQFKEVKKARKCIRTKKKKCHKIERAKDALSVISIMVTWSMENAVETADSMKSRGYGLAGRTAYSIFRFSKRDQIIFYWLILMGFIVALGGVRKTLNWWYYPTMSGAKIDFFSICIFTAYFALSITPVVLNFREDRRWKYYQLKI